MTPFTTATAREMGISEKGELRFLDDTLWAMRKGLGCFTDLGSNRTRGGYACVPLETNAAGSSPAESTSSEGSLMPESKSRHVAKANPLIPSLASESLGQHLSEDGLYAAQRGNGDLDAETSRGQIARVPNTSTAVTAMPIQSGEVQLMTPSFRESDKCQRSGFLTDNETEER